MLDLAGLDDAPLALDAKGDLTMRQGRAVAVLGEVEHPAASLLENSYFVSNLLPVQVRSRTWGKKWSTIFESTDPSQVQIEYKELENCAFAVLIWIKSNR